MTEFDAAITANRANWDDRADVHVASPFYDVDWVVSDPTATSEVVDNDLVVLAPHLDGGTVKREIVAASAMPHRPRHRMLVAARSH